MQVRDILRNKNTHVVTIDREAAVGHAIALLVQNNIGSLPVVDQSGALIGILSERDVLRGLHNQGDRFAAVSVSQVMTRDPVTCRPGDDLEEVMGQMSGRRIAKLPVLDGDVIVGIISVGDVIKVMYGQVHAENQHLMTYIHGVF
jgi:CBS domain-containing protein